MILDQLSMLPRYVPTHPGLATAARWLRATTLSELPLGRHAIDGERLLVIVGSEQGRGREQARLEAHRRYIDIQIVLDGRDVCGWCPRAQCMHVSEAYDPERDIEFFADRPETWFDLGLGQMAIFFPDDAHAPLAGAGPLQKVVMKVAVEWQG